MIRTNYQSLILIGFLMVWGGLPARAQFTDGEKANREKLIWDNWVPQYFEEGASNASLLDAEVVIIGDSDHTDNKQKVVRKFLVKRLMDRSPQFTKTILLLEGIDVKEMIKPEDFKDYPEVNGLSPQIYVGGWDKIALSENALKILWSQLGPILEWVVREGITSGLTDDCLTEKQNKVLAKAIPLLDYQWSKIKGTFEEEALEKRNQIIKKQFQGFKNYSGTGSRLILIGGANHFNPTMISFLQESGLRYHHLITKPTRNLSAEGEKLMTMKHILGLFTF